MMDPIFQEGKFNSSGANSDIPLFITRPAQASSSGGPNTGKTVVGSSFWAQEREGGRVRFDSCKANSAMK